MRRGDYEKGGLFLFDCWSFLAKQPARLLLVYAYVNKNSGWFAVSTTMSLE